MKKAVIYGAGGTGSKIYELIKDSVEVIAFVDSDSKKWGGNKCSLPINSVDWLMGAVSQYDVIYIATLTGVYDVENKLQGLGIPAWKIDKTYAEISVKSRILFLRRHAELIYKKNVIVH